MNIMRKLQLLMAMLVLLCTTAFAQNRIVTGRVTDDKDDPVPFASVKVVGTKTGVSADENGYFKISVPQNATLEFSATGSETKQVTVAGQDVINVSITKVSQELTAVVVTTSLGIKRQAKELGYAASSLTNKVLTQGKSVNVQQA